MIRHHEKEDGSVQAVISVVVILSVLVTIGVLYWQNTNNNVEPETRNIETSIQNEIVDDREVILTTGNFNGETGTFQARGYLYLEKVQEAFCDDNCKTYDRAFFYIKESPNDSIFDYINDSRGNSFIADNAVALGCVIDDKIQAIGASTGTPSGDKIYSKEIFDALKRSSESSLIAVEIGRSTVPVGRGAPTCYSHFDSISTL